MQPSLLAHWAASFGGIFMAGSRITNVFSLLGWLILSGCVVVVLAVVLSAFFTVGMKGLGVPLEYSGRQRDENGTPVMMPTDILAQYTSANDVSGALKFLDAEPDGLKRARLAAFLLNSLNQFPPAPSTSTDATTSLSPDPSDQIRDYLASLPPSSELSYAYAILGRVYRTANKNLESDKAFAKSLEISTTATEHPLADLWNRIWQWFRPFFSERIGLTVCAAMAAIALLFRPVLQVRARALAYQIYGKSKDHNIQRALKAILEPKKDD
jgi:hypothetical protein